MSTPRASFEVFPEDILSCLLGWLETGELCALAHITETEGGGVRPPGALMAISACGTSSGYLSGGCIDSDVVQQAIKVIEDGSPASLRYGKGSPFMDLPLPCGGSIAIEILPINSSEALKRAAEALANREPAWVNWQSVCSAASAGHHIYQPKLRLRIAGRGADCLALAELAQVSGYDVHLQLPDEDDVLRAQRIGIQSITHLTTRDTLPDAEDDLYTAFVLMFHDRHWETPLLSQALSGEAFYIGAVGSQATHQKRIPELQRAGHSKDEIRRIHAPIGLLPARRDAPSLATSILAEILAVQSRPPHAQYSKSGAILLAAGASSRFEHGDKLLHEIDQSNVLTRSAESLRQLKVLTRLAVVDAGNQSRIEALEGSGWAVIENSLSAQGQSTSLKLGLQALAANPEVETFLVLLGDMPFVPADHIQSLFQAMETGVTAVMTRSGGTLMPPALFSRAALPVLLKIEGDRGAGAVFRALDNTRTVELEEALARDIDTLADLTPKETVDG